MSSNELLVRRLLQSTYVNDIITGGESEDEVFNLYSQAKEMFCTGGFNLRKFLTNSRALQEQIDRAEGLKLPTMEDAHCIEETYAEATLGGLQCMDVGEHKVLGVSWNPNSDQLIVDVTELAQLATTVQPTKRNLISVIGKFYDPLGLLAPVTIRFKILFQILCQRKLEWDNPLPEELIQEWNDLVADLSEGQRIFIPRGYANDVNEPISSTTLHGFCDASTIAYGAAVYLALKTEANNIIVRFVTAKTQVAPLKSQTIPRLELLSAFLLSRLMVSVSDSLKPTMPKLELKCYTDFQVALYWICGTGREWKPFVQNRVNEIRRNVHPDSWSHCPGKTNPADLPSRGLTMLELSVSRLWSVGPEWLSAGVSPCLELELTAMPEAYSTELRASSKLAHALLTVESHTTIGDVINCERFSSLVKLMRVTSHVLRAVKRFKKLKCGGLLL